MSQAVLAFASYLGTAIVLLAAFAWLYEKVTPYREFHLIKENNCAAAVTLSGAMLGFTFPMMSSIFYTQSLLEMVVWSGITGAVQILVFTVLRGWAKDIAQGKVAPAIFVAAASIAVGLLNAVCISH
jgi:putative membrane protein